MLYNGELLAGVVVEQNETSDSMKIVKKEPLLK